MSILKDQRPRWLLERRWETSSRPLGRRYVVRDKSPRLTVPFDLTYHLRRLCEDAIVRSPDLGHIDPSSVLFTVTPARNRSAYGLQARVTPMRFRDGASYRRFRGSVYQVQRYYVDGREILYLVTFCVPRFLDQTFEEKLVTVFHELYHIGPQFDGDLRRHDGRYEVHSHSKKRYDARMSALVRRYLADHPEPELFAFLHHTSASLKRLHGTVVGTVVPRPKMVPVESGQWKGGSEQ